MGAPSPYSRGVVSVIRGELLELQVRARLPLLEAGDSKLMESVRGCQSPQGPCRVRSTRARRTGSQAIEPSHASQRPVTAGGLRYAWLMRVASALLVAVFVPLHARPQRDSDRTGRLSSRRSKDPDSTMNDQEDPIHSGAEHYPEVSTLAMARPEADDACRAAAEAGTGRR